MFAAEYNSGLHIVSFYYANSITLPQRGITSDETRNVFVSVRLVVQSRVCHVPTRVLLFRRTPDLRRVDLTRKHRYVIYCVYTYVILSNVRVILKYINILYAILY